MAKREEILDAALEEYEKNGYDRTSFREIARRSGLTQAGLIHYFPTKESLFIELLRRRDERWASDPDPNECGHSVNQLITAVEQNESETALVRLFVNMSAESTTPQSKSRHFFEERYSWLRSEIANDVRQMQSNGQFPDSYDAADVATILIAVADGLQLQWLLRQEDIEMAAQLRRLWEVLRSAVPSTHSLEPTSGLPGRPDGWSRG